MSVLGLPSRGCQTWGGRIGIHGGIVGAAFLLIARTVLPDLRTLGGSLFPASEVLQRLAERWLLYFGVLFILVVFFFPKGVLGTLRGTGRSRVRSAG